MARAIIAHGTGDNHPPRGLRLVTFLVDASALARRRLGLDALRGIVGAVNRPVLAIGGVGVSEAPAVAAIGAAGVAGVRLFGTVPDGDRRTRIAARVQALRAAFDRRGTLQ